MTEISDVHLTSVVPAAACTAVLFANKLLKMPRDALADSGVAWEISSNTRVRVAVTVAAPADAARKEVSPSFCSAPSSGLQLTVKVSSTASVL